MYILTDKKYLNKVALASLVKKQKKCFLAKMA